MSVVQGSYRRATEADVFELMRLHQLCSSDPAREQGMVNHHRVRDAIVNSPDFWGVWEDPDMGFQAAAFVMVESDQRLCKIHRLYVHPEVRDSESLATDLLRELIRDMDREGAVDVCYTTTGKLSQKQIDLTAQLGFVMLGIFPNAMSADTSKMNAIAAYYFRDTLTEKRVGGHKLHPVIHPFFNIVRRQCGLPTLPVREPSEVKLEAERAEPLSGLEVIEAPNFVANRFARLNEKKSMSVSFYPFQTPTTLLTGPNQEIEIFAAIVPEIRFAMIIGERMERPIDPVAMYVKACELLKERGVSYVEIINDAADVVGSEVLLNAGFLPSVYFPALKRHGDSRRDYAIFGRAFEKNVLKPGALSPVLRSFWEEYRRIEG